VSTALSVINREEVVSVIKGTDVQVKRIKTGWLVSYSFEDIAEDKPRDVNYKSDEYAFDDIEKALDKVAELLPILEAE
jgi:hypothetical protein